MRIIFKGKHFHYIPILGILSFLILFIFSSLLYSGGSEINPNSTGFNWINNYYCDLMLQNGFNGRPNPARPFSILTLNILSLSIIVFFIIVKDIVKENKFWKYTIPIAGTISMLLILFLFTPFHRLLIIIASIIGSLALTGIIIGLIQKQWKPLLYLTYFNLVMIGLNIFIYVSKTMTIVLPIIQKLTFLTVFFWMISLNIKLIKSQKNK